MASSVEKRQQAIYDFLVDHPESSSSLIHEAINVKGELITTKRALTEMVGLGMINVLGIGRATRYVVNPTYTLMRKIDIEQYFASDADKRTIISGYNFDLPQLLSGLKVFDERELNHLWELNVLRLCVAFFIFFEGSGNFLKTIFLALALQAL